MPPAYTAQQKASIQQYAQFAKVKDSVAAKALKAANWDVNAALNEHYNKGPKTGTETLTSTINSVFDKYRDDPTNNPDTIGVEGTMSLMSAIDVTLEEPASVAIHHLAGAESMGELERSKFVPGWETRLINTNGDGSVESMKTAASAMRLQMSSDRDYFRAVYRHAFLLGRAPGQKSAQTETALELWRLMLADGTGGMAWKTSNVDWLSMWLAFIEAKELRVVSRDLWNQTEVFARKSLDDESLSFWSEEASWPTVIDEFVAHAKEKRAATAMDLE